MSASFSGLAVPEEWVRSSGEWVRSSGKGVVRSSGKGVVSGVTGSGVVRSVSWVTPLVGLDGVTGGGASWSPAWVSLSDGGRLAPASSCWRTRSVVSSAGSVTGVVVAVAVVMAFSGVVLGSSPFFSCCWGLAGRALSTVQRAPIIYRRSANLPGTGSMG